MIELLIAVVLSSIVFLAALYVLKGQRTTYITQQAKTEAQEAVERAHGELLDKIRVAGYQIPPDVAAIVPYYVPDGPDSIKVAANYENYNAPLRKSINPNAPKIEVTKATTPRWRGGTNVMVRKISGDTIYTCWTGVDTIIERPLHYEFWLADSNKIFYTFPESSRVTTFNSYTYKVATDAEGIPYLGMRINDTDSLYRLIDGVEDITLTYETRGDTTDRNTMPDDSLGYIYAVNLEIKCRSTTQDFTHTDTLYNDHYWRTELKSQVVVLNLAIERR